jgi:hypothetical protein
MGSAIRHEGTYQLHDSVIVLSKFNLPRQLKSNRLVIRKTAGGKRMIYQADGRFNIIETGGVLMVEDSVPFIPQREYKVAQVKFNDMIPFEKYQVAQFDGSMAPVNFNSNKDAKRFKTVLTGTYQSEGLNFAGHYCFVSWGCGTSCQSSAIIDLRSGAVFFGPIASAGYKFKADSRLLVVNPPDAAGYYEDCNYCSPEIWIWDDAMKTFIKKS